MKKIPKLEENVLKALEKAGADVSVADIIRRAQLTMPRGNLSSRLCELRTKGYATSYQQDGVNYWSLTQAGLAALNGDIPADIPAPEVAPESPESPENQPIDGDISADISADISEVEAECGCRACLPDSGLPDPDVPILAYRLDEVEIRADLVTESHHVRQVERFPALNDALFVLDTLSTAYCRDLPAYREEINRIADFLKTMAA